MAYRNDLRSLALQPIVPTTEEEAANLLAKQAALEVGEESGWIMLAVELRDERRMIGEVGLYLSAGATSLGDLGWSIHPDYQRNGYATEAAHVLLAYAFHELGLHRVTAQCDARNIPSARLMERLGMRREGHFRQSRLHEDVWIDTYLYALLREEWIARDAS